MSQSWITTWINERLVPWLSDSTQQQWRAKLNHWLRHQTLRHSQAWRSTQGVKLEEGSNLWGDLIDCHSKFRRNRKTHLRNCLRLSWKIQSQTGNPFSAFVPGRSQEAKRQTKKCQSLNKGNYQRLLQRKRQRTYSFWAHHQKILCLQRRL